MLDQLMAFTVNPGHERQVEVWEALKQRFGKQPHDIRRMLTEGAVRASDRRARFVGLAAYEAAGGVVLRDLFQADDGGWLQDAALLERMVAEKLSAEADAVRAEGWAVGSGWNGVFPTATLMGCGGSPASQSQSARRTNPESMLCGASTPIWMGRSTPSGESQPVDAPERYGHPDDAARTAPAKPIARRTNRCDSRLGATPRADELARKRQAIGELETAIESIEQRPLRFAAEDIAIAGAFVSVDAAGKLRIDRGFVRPEDEPAVEPEPEPQPDDGLDGVPLPSTIAEGVGSTCQTVSAVQDDDEIDDPSAPLSDRLLMSLSAHRRTLALADASSRTILRWRFLQYSMR
ncbi:MAG: hypothetical protein AcusKO_02750 [Acuticoccus sp.]